MFRNNFHIYLLQCAYKVITSSSLSQGASVSSCIPYNYIFLDIQQSKCVVTPQKFIQELLTVLYKRGQKMTF
jgi:hypothetical protein